MLGWTLNKNKPEQWQGKYLLKCSHYIGTNKCVKSYLMYCDVLHRTKSGNLKILVYGNLWKETTGKPRVRYLELHEQNRIVLYKNYVKG